LEKVEKFYRYLDVDGDGVPYRTLPGTSPKGAYFTRGSGHNKFGGYTEDAAEYQEVMDRIARKIASAAKAVPSPVFRGSGKAKLGLVTVGSCHAACVEALDKLKAQGVDVDYMRVRGFPFGEEVRAFLEAHETNYVVEQNRDGQLRSLLILETGVEQEKLASIRFYSGLPMSTKYILDRVHSSMAVPA
jgi:2-oxoglutarate ferredoxin oxidoreductase subunit alpha